jgi:hypothetical protein
MRQQLRLVDFTYATLLGALCVLAMPAAAQEPFNEETLNGVRVWSPKPSTPAPVVQQRGQPSVSIDVGSTTDSDTSDLGSTDGVDTSGLDTDGMDTSGLDADGMDTTGLDGPLYVGPRLDGERRIMRRR